jgi:hypothetical protein
VTCSVPLTAQQQDATLIREAQSGSNQAVAARDIGGMLAESANARANPGRGGSSRESLLSSDGASG